MIEKIIFKAVKTALKAHDHLKSIPLITNVFTAQKGPFILMGFGLCTQRGAKVYFDVFSPYAGLKEMTQVQNALIQVLESPWAQPALEEDGTEGEDVHEDHGEHQSVTFKLQSYEPLTEKLKIGLQGRRIIFLVKINHLMTGDTDARTRT